MWVGGARGAVATGRVERVRWYHNLLAIDLRALEVDTAPAVALYGTLLALPVSRSEEA
jgi:hypothetical protein